MRQPFIILTCEHASHRVPSAFKKEFRGQKAILLSHRGWDEGALPVAKTLSRKLSAPLISGHYSRLVIDLNRSSKSKAAFSPYTQNLSAKQKQKVIESIHEPFRNKTQMQIEKIIHGSLGPGKDKGFTLPTKTRPIHPPRKRSLSSPSATHSVFHLSIHTFTPSLNGEVRNCEIGILYDPKRKNEALFAKNLKQTLKNHFQGIRVRMNYPYKGISDGHTTHLRKIFDQKSYAGIELEINQAWHLGKKPNAINLIAKAINEALAQ
jgi:predicted N-formylglutamate amidohydrolase